MTSLNEQYGQRILDFVERLQQLSNYEDICELIVSEMGNFGFTNVTSFSIPSPDADLKTTIQFSTVPESYIDRYAEKQHLQRDPRIKELRATLQPHSWSDLRHQRRPSKRELAILNDEMQEFGARDGFVVPIVNEIGAMGVFAASGPEPDLSPQARSALEIIGIYSYNALQKALVRKRRLLHLDKPLTRREREIMQWVAIGKSDDEIADILSISRETVTSHVEGAKKKLGAARRTFAVFQAIRAGEIHL
ncbi:MAG TPA: LuxR family transcriptional regulator [Beijerinckia sp.]|jgi:LuxR family quorum sensing-dependent transcriptional regulator|nr:LuxR family transcriptional regulator [Beijerinckia sp.]